jgi:hypothetical protein
MSSVEPTRSVKRIVTIPVVPMRLISGGGVPTRTVAAAGTVGPGRRRGTAGVTFSRGRKHLRGVRRDQPGRAQVLRSVWGSSGPAVLRGLRSEQRAGGAILR